MDTSFEIFEPIQDPQVIDEGQSLRSVLLNLVTNTSYKLNDVFTQKIQISAKSSPVYMLGKKYSYKQDLNTEQEFYKNFKQIIWFSYRQNIKILNKGTLTNISDAGWGCLIRVAQMLLALCISRYFCGQDSEMIEEIQRNIINLFSDFQTNSKISPFSIQQIIQRSQQSDYKFQVGDWYTGPKIMTILQDLNENLASHLFGDFKIINFYDQCIMEDQLYDLQKREYQSDSTNVKQKQFNLQQDKSERRDIEWQNSLLIIVHTRLGLDMISLSYLPSIKSIMQMKSFVGAIGGKKAKSYFILGFQDDQAIYIDPHYVKECDENQDQVDSRFSGYFADNPKLITMSSLSPSISFCFYIRTELEYLVFKKEVLLNLQNSKGVVFSIFHNGIVENGCEQFDKMYANFELI